MMLFYLRESSGKTIAVCSFTVFFEVIDSIVSASEEPQSKTTELEFRVSWPR